MPSTPLLAVLLAAPPTVFTPRDFVEYWSAARVHLRGGDPYSADELLPFQREAAGEPGRAEAVMLWTPPWTLPLYWPAGLLSPRDGQLLWLAVQVGAMGLAAVLAWRVYAGPPPAGVVRRAAWEAAPLALAAGFAPCWWAVVYGQNTGPVALGVAGFVYLRTRGRPGWAGAVAALTAVKPHLLLLFGVALVLDAVTRAGRRALLAGVGMVAAFALLALLPDPDVYADFLAALGRPKTGSSTPLSGWAVPTAGYFLRAAVPGKPFVVQFVPALVGCVAVIPYYLVRRRSWDWAAETPRLVLASALAAPYGAWLFDLTILLVPVAAATGRLVGAGRAVPVAAAAVGWVGLSLLTLWLPAELLRWGFAYKLHHFVWFAPVVLAGYWLAGRAAPSTAGPAGGVDSSCGAPCGTPRSG